MTANDPLLQPLTLKGLTLKNRIVSTPHAPAYADAGMPGERYQRYHEEKARGGIGMTMFGGSSCIGPDSPSVFGQLYVGEDRVIPYFQAFAERIRAHDCGIMCQISHLGRRTTWNAADWLPVIAPSRVREPAHRGFPREMDHDDIARVIGYYADAAWRCKEGGLDGVEILSHGHLPGQFLSPDSNQRTDGYGGSFANRFRFTAELLEAVRKRVGDDFIVGVRMVADEGTTHGQQLDEGILAARTLEADGMVDYLCINHGHIATDHGLANHMPGMGRGLAPWINAVAAVRREVSMPLIHACRLSDVATARYAIAQGIVDLVGMTRAHIADPHIVNKLKAGREEDIRPCVGAAYCIDRIYGEGEALCLHNAATGREATMPHIIPPSPTPGRRVVILGGGPAGLEAARVCAERGHSVILFEATDNLGGQLVLAAKASWRRDLIGIRDFYARRLETLGVDIRWNTLADEQTVLDEQPDVVIIATGGVPDTDYVPGGDACKSVWDVLSGEPVSGKVLVYDDIGQHQATSCADWLCTQEGVFVEIVTPDRQVAAEMGGVNSPFYLEHFYQNGVRMTPDFRLESVERDGNRLKATFTNEFGGPGMTRVADHIVVEHGTLPADEVFYALRAGAANHGITDLDALLAGEAQPADNDGYQLFRIGDAASSRNIHAAIYDALRLCKDL